MEGGQFTCNSNGGDAAFFLESRVPGSFILWNETMSTVAGMSNGFVIRMLE